MAKKDKKSLEVGDVFTSKDLVYAQYHTESYINDDDEEIVVNKTSMTVRSKYYFDSDHSSGFTYTSYYTKRGEEVEVEHDNSAYDPTRAERKFVVVKAVMTGGSTGRDPYPDALHCVARCVDDPTEEIHFVVGYGSDCYNTAIKKFKKVSVDKKVKSEMLKRMESYLELRKEFEGV